MSDDEFEEEPELDEDVIDDDDLVEDFDDDDDAELLVEDEIVDEVVDEPVVDPEVVTEEPVGGTAELEEDDDDVVDLDEELHPDDVEEALDVVLRERTAKVGLEDSDGGDDDEPDDRGEAGTKIMPRRPGEFLCSSCFLVLPRHQLADEKRMLCRDCA